MPTRKKSPAINHLLAVMARLRSPTGCPWDREQDHMTLRFHAVEEVYELMDAIEAGDDHEMAEELGDLLLQVVFHCQLARERGAFDFEKVARSITDKLIRRHPHVFGDVVAEDADTVLANWEAIKKTEREDKQEDASSLAGVPVGLPALQRAQRMCGKAVSAGFRWSSVAGALAKVHEEQRELDEALRACGLDRTRRRRPRPTSAHASSTNWAT